MQSPPSTTRNGVNRVSSPGAAREVMTEAPKKRHNLTPIEQQALQLQKLLANPDREVKIPKPTKEKELRAPRETIKNVSGSSAGAGSGEFHVYKHSRRREYERIKLMEDKAKKEKEIEEYEERQKLLQQQVSAKTNKNRAKREKKKNAKMAAKGGSAIDKDVANEDQREKEDGEEDQQLGITKRKRINAEGTAQIVFRKKEDEGSEDEG